MSPLEAKWVIEALANGINPVTGERLPDESPFNEPQIIRALFTAVQTLSQDSTKQKKNAKSPDNAGKSWSEAEDSKLLSEFDSGKPVKEIAGNHSRTLGAITSRLVRLGRIQERNDAYVTSEPTSS